MKTIRGYELFLYVRTFEGRRLYQIFCYVHCLLCHGLYQGRSCRSIAVLAVSVAKGEQICFSTLLSQPIQVVESDVSERRYACTPRTQILPPV